MSLTKAIPLIIGVARFRHLKRSHYFLMVWLSLGLFTELIATNMPGNNLYVYNAYTILECFVIGLFIYSQFRIPAILFVFLILSVINILFLVYSPNTFNSYSLLFTGSTITFLLGFTIYKYSYSNEYDLTENSEFMVTASLLLYFTGALIIFALSDIFFQYTIALIFIWTINAFLNLITNLLLAFTLWKIYPRKSFSL